MPLSSPFRIAFFPFRGLSLPGKYGGAQGGVHSGSHCPFPGRIPSLSFPFYQGAFKILRESEFFRRARHSSRISTHFFPFLRVSIAFYLCHSYRGTRRTSPISSDLASHSFPFLCVRISIPFAFSASQGSMEGPREASLRGPILSLSVSHSVPFFPFLPGALKILREPEL